MCSHPQYLSSEPRDLEPTPVVEEPVPELRGTEIGSVGCWGHPEEAGAMQDEVEHPGEGLG